VSQRLVLVGGVDLTLTIIMSFDLNNLSTTEYLARMPLKQLSFTYKDDIQAIPQWFHIMKKENNNGNSQVAPNGASGSYQNC